MFLEGCPTPFSKDLQRISEASLVFCVRFSVLLQVAQIHENRALASMGALLLRLGLFEITRTITKKCPNVEVFLRRGVGTDFFSDFDSILGLFLDHIARKTCSRKH